MHHNRPLAFIHLSDIHFKKGTSDTSHDLDNDIRNEISRDIRKLKEVVDTFDGILVTGDIAFSGRKEEYDIAEEWLAQLSALIGCKPEEVWVVPGNHDVNRTKDTGLVKHARQGLRDSPESMIDTKFKELIFDDIDGGECVFRPLADYCEFAAKYQCNTSPQEPQWKYDFKLNDGSTLRLVGLNSVILSYADDNDGNNRLILNSHQLSSLKNEDGVEYMTLCHHPGDWLKNRDSIITTLKSRVRVQLYGHKHKYVCEVVDESTVSIVAGATHPSRLEKSWIPRYNTITILVEVDENYKRRLHIRIYPRIWNEHKQVFSPDYNCCDEGKNYRSASFILQSWKPAAEIVAEDISMVVDPVIQDNFDKKDSDIPLDIKKLTYDYLTLSYPKQMKIANELELLTEEDAGLEKSELFKRILARAKDKDLLSELSVKIKSLKINS